MRKFISKVTASGWFMLFILIMTLVIGSKVRNRFWPEEEPVRQTLDIHIDDFDNLSVYAKEAVVGVEFTWDFLKQEMTVDNRYNDVPAEIEIIGESMGKRKLGPREHYSFTRRVAIGGLVGVDVSVDQGDGNVMHSRKFFIIGKNQLAVSQNQ